MTDDHRVHDPAYAADDPTDREFADDRRPIGVLLVKDRRRLQRRVVFMSGGVITANARASLVPNSGGTIV